MRDTLPIIVGDKADYPLQTWLRGSNGIMASYGASDLLQAFVYQGKSLTSLFAPTVTWYTKSSTQTGYTQGQILVSISNAQSAMLIPNGLNTLLVQWAPSSAPTAWSSIVRLQLIVDPIGVLT